MARQKSQCWHSENPEISRDQWSMTQRLTTDLLFWGKDVDLETPGFLEQVVLSPFVGQATSQTKISSKL